MAEVHALLIGIDAYPVSTSKGWSPQPLPGCARDVEDIEVYLRSRFDRLRLDKLVAPDTGSSSFRPPTSKNIRQSLQCLVEMTRAGDQVIVFYAGHGHRRPSRRPAPADLEFDECLVPLDVAENGEEALLADFEIAEQVRRMLSQDVLVTLLFDCCHAGGAAKEVDAGAVEKGIELGVPMRRRDVTCRNPWFPEMDAGGVFLASCQPHQRSHQLWCEGRFRGYFTYHLIRILREVGPRSTWQAVHRRLVGAIHRELPQQTPRLEGDINRFVFGRDLGPWLRSQEALSDSPRQVFSWAAKGLSSFLVRGIVELLEGEEKLRMSELDRGEDFVVMGSGGGTVQIMDRRWNRYQIPGLMGEAEGVAEVLQHLSHYHWLLELEGPSNWIQHSLSVTVELPDEKEELLDGWSSASYLVIPEVSARVTQVLLLKVENLGPRMLYLTVLNLQPGWSIQQVYPSDGLTVPLEPGRTEGVEVEICATPFRTPDLDVLLWFVSSEEVDLHGFEKPGLDLQGKALGSSGREEFDELCALLTSGRLGHRASKTPGFDWAVGKVAIRTEDPP